MIGIDLGRTRMLIAHRRLVLHADRIEELSASVFGLQVRRLPLDELESATVRRRFAAWVELLAIGLLAVLGLGFGALALWGPGGFVAGVLALLALIVAAGLAVAALVESPYELVLNAEGTTMSVLLPRRKARREAALDALRRAAFARQGGQNPDHGL